MIVSDVKALIRQSKATDDPKAAGRFIDVADEVFTKAKEDYSAKSVRLARAGRVDPIDNTSRTITSDLNIVWVHENFFRVGGVDYHFWSIGTFAYLSKVRPTEDSTPRHAGRTGVTETGERCLFSGEHWS